MTKVLRVKAKDSHNPNPFVDSPAGLKCILTDTMRENFENREFLEFVGVHLKDSFYIEPHERHDGTAWIHLSVDKFDALRDVYKHFFGSNF